MHKCSPLISIPDAQFAKRQQELADAISRSMNELSYHAAASITQIPTNIQQLWSDLQPKPPPPPPPPLARHSA